MKAIMSRLDGIERDMRVNAPVHNMRMLLNRLSPAKIVPQPNKYYTFIYVAKTPGISYDRHPFVLCGDVFKWGFTGFNQHWEETRRYSWNEVQSNIFEIYQDEFETVSNLPTALIRNS